MLCSLVLAACGGSSDALRGISSSTSSTTGTTGTSTVASITVTSSTATIAADGSTSATITATAKDKNNNLVSGVTVAFGASAGGLAVTSATTSASGTATATLTAGSATSGTAITVTATSGTASGKVTVTVGTAAQTITVVTSAPQIPSDGSKSATITAFVRNAQNQFVSGVTVGFAATSGGLAVTQATTDATGAATATLSAAGDPTDRTITVTATAGSSSVTVPVSVTGTAITVGGAATLVLNATGTYTVSLTNSANVGIANEPVTLTSKLGNTLSATSVTTSTTGQASFTVTAVKSGTDVITATALGISSTASVGISAQNFSFTTPSASAAVTNVNLTNATTPVSQKLAVVWTVSGVPQVGQTVTFASTRGTLSSTTATTDATGAASVTISSTVAGPATVTATATGVTTQTQLEFIATTPAAIDLQASPATIDTQGQSTLTAVVRDANNNLVEGQTVTFQTVNDVTGGSLSVPSAVTDVQGRAQTVYTASSTPSASNGVVVQATVAGISTTADLTVGGLAVGLSLGTGNTLTQLPVGCGSTGTSLCTEFELAYSVIATDTAGNPVPNVAVTLTIHALDYGKGYYNLTNGTQPWVLHTTATCINEDDSQSGAADYANFNGVLDAGEDGCTNGVTPTGTTVAAPLVCNPTGNQNGKLDPGATAVASPGSVTTGSDGTATFNVIYPQDIANWVTVQLIASTTVSGTETSSSVSFLLPILADDLTSAASPPGQPSPYGSATSCTNPN